MFPALAVQRGPTMAKGAPCRSPSEAGVAPALQAESLRVPLSLAVPCSEVACSSLLSRGMLGSGTRSR